MSETLLEADDLHTYYGPSHILRGVSFKVRRGEALSLMGRNGMGKTTTLRSLVGLTAPRRGRVALRGRDVTGRPPHEIARQGVALVPEGRGIFPNLTVREHLLMAARVGTDGRRDWDLPRVLGLFPRLAERADNYGNQLSGGEQQMLTIGRALMTNPDLLMLDEATEGLAPLIRREIWHVIQRIKAAGIATIIVDKDIRALSAVSDRSVIIAKGRIVFEGTTAELAAQPDIAAKHLGV
ncbi:MAG: ABC transporter ATP-binding protein [Alphaproteobacteria bacterium]|nr:ABC transporter ATP-binding protein [Alphaproteobacteria bacterium]